MKTYHVQIENTTWPMTKAQIKGIFEENTAKMILKVNRQGGKVKVPFDRIKKTVLNELSL